MLKVKVWIAESEWHLSITLFSCGPLKRQTRGACFDDLDLILTLLSGSLNQHNAEASYQGSYNFLMPAANRHWHRYRRGFSGMFYYFLFRFFLLTSSFAAAHKVT